MKLGPACPTCGTLAPFGRTQWGRGKPFDCKGCGARLVMPRSYLALMLLAAYWVLRDQFAGPFERISLAVVLLALALVIEWVREKPRPAVAEDSPR